MKECLFHLTVIRRWPHRLLTVDNLQHGTHGLTMLTDQQVKLAAAIVSFDQRVSLSMI
jgi:hypothetical protein